MPAHVLKCSNHLLAVFLCLGIALTCILSRRPGEPKSFHAVLPPKLWIHLAVVACGNRLEETLVMLKSAVLFSHRKMHFHIFTEESLKPEFDKQVNLQILQHNMCRVSWAVFWEKHILFTDVFCCTFNCVTLHL